MKTTSCIYTSALIATLALSAPIAHAQILAQWDFSSNLEATEEAPGITASAVSYGSFSGFSPSGNTYTRSSGGQDLFARVFQAPGGSDRILGTSESIAVDTRQTYFEFTLTPSSATDFGTLTADITAQVISSSDPGNSFEAHYLLRSSQDGFVSNIGTGSISTPSTDANSGSNRTGEFSADISSFQDIDSTITFRLYTYVTSDGSLNSNHVIRLDNITVNAIPEPSQAAIAFGIVSLAAIASVRRRRKS
ncbi:hypothetical protein [Puniceicoccus vermicola]|uniref:PEP-CTERM sorting domain-containing protein n=1 Tax=Puniceicoccus vermicola TaxID=388746 RepID=A0A7X1B0L1_9BACT|nr:hypothetical protein [Puniceicoccus vermicola]MBC2603416.1 hypothetical protein [Puniceicoccus vermicola]